MTGLSVLCSLLLVKKKKKKNNLPPPENSWVPSWVAASKIIKHSGPTAKTSGNQTPTHFSSAISHFYTNPLFQTEVFLQLQNFCSNLAFSNSFNNNVLWSCSKPGTMPGKRMQRGLQHSPWIFLAGQWLRICLPLQGTWVWSLVRELRSCILQGNKRRPLATMKT